MILYGFEKFIIMVLKLNGTWSNWPFLFRLWTKINFDWFIIKKKTVTTIIFRHVWKESVIYFSPCTHRKVTSESCQINRILIAFTIWQLTWNETDYSIIVQNKPKIGNYNLTIGWFKNKQERIFTVCIS